MRNPLLPKHHIYRRPITCLGLAFLITSCAAQEIPEEPAAIAPSDTTEETIVTDETTAPPATQSPEATEVSMSQSLTDRTEELLESFDQGTEYAVVRARLLQEGWVPVKAPEPGSFGVEREAYDAGFIEVSGCAGTGLGQCRFDFEHPDKKKALSITTYGGSDLQFGDWSINPLSKAQAAASAGSDDITLTGSSAIIQEGRNEIPTQFQGEWNMNLAECGSSLSDGRLVISDNQLQFYESVGTASQIMVTGTAGLTVTSEYFGEGETFTDTDSFRLSGDNSTLTHLETDAVRYRCPG